MSLVPKRLLSVMIENNIKKLFFLPTAVYGIPEYLPLDEKNNLKAYKSLWLHKAPNRKKTIDIYGKYEATN